MSGEEASEEFPRDLDNLSEVDKKKWFRVEEIAGGKVLKVRPEMFTQPIIKGDPDFFEKVVIDEKMNEKATGKFTSQWDKLSEEEKNKWFTPEELLGYKVVECRPDNFGWPEESPPRVSFYKMRQEAEVVLFTRPGCVFCEKAKDLLVWMEYVKVFQIVLDDQADYEAARAEMIRASEGSTTVPQVFINGVHVPGGFTGLKGLKEQGKLEGLLQNTTRRFENKQRLLVTRVALRPTEMDF